MLKGEKQSALLNFMCDRIIMENIKSANVPAIVIGVKEYGEKRDGLG